MLGEPSPSSERARRGFAAFAIVVAVALAYGASLRGAWVYDDWPGIVENDTLRSFVGSWSPPGDSGSPVAGRPLVNVTFAMNHALSGVRPWSYHLVNVLIHAAAALVLYGLARRTLARWRGSARSERANEWVAFTLGLLWAMHPLGTEAVAYVAQRAESLMTCFYLLSLYAFARGVAPERAAPDALRAGGRGWLATSVVACACGMATKEVMVSAPLVIALYDRTFVAGSLAAAWRRRRGYYLALAATWIVLALLVVGNATRGGTAGFSAGASWWQYAEAQVAAQVWYLRLAVWPAPLVFDYGVVALPFTGALPVCGLILAALVAVAVLAAVRRTAVGWVTVAYFAVLAPSSSVLPIVTEPMAEHRMYLPLALLLAAAVTACVASVGRRFVSAAVVMAVAFGALTLARERVYRSERVLWTDTVAKAPANARAYYNLGRADASAGDLRGALAHYQAAIGREPDFASARSNLSNILLQLGDIAAARREAAQAVQLNPALAEAHNNLGNAMLLMSDTAEALREYERAVQLVPTSLDFRDNYATALANLGRFDASLAEFARLVREHPASPLLHFNYANTLARSGQFHRAISEYLKTLALDPDYPRARENLARARVLDSGPRGKLE